MFRISFRLILIIVSVIASHTLFAQLPISEKVEKVIITDFQSSLYSGCRIYSIDSIQTFIVIAVKLPIDKYSKDKMNIMAEVKAKQALNSFINGDNVNSELIYVIEDKKEDGVELHHESFTERIVISSQGMVRGIHSLYESDYNDDRMYLFVNFPNFH